MTEPNDDKPENPENGAPVDLVQLRASTEGDREFEKQCLGAFIRQSNENLQALNDACVDGKSDAWVEAAHMFKGGALSIGAVMLSKLCSDAQYMSEVTADQRKSLFQRIRDEYEKVTDYLKTAGAL